MASKQNVNAALEGAAAAHNTDDVCMCRTFKCRGNGTDHVMLEFIQKLRIVYQNNKKNDANYRRMCHGSRIRRVRYSLL